MNLLLIGKDTRVKGMPWESVYPAEETWRGMCGVARGQPKRCSGAARVELESGRLEAGGDHCSSYRLHPSFILVSASGRRSPALYWRERGKQTKSSVVALRGVGEMAVP